MIVRKLQGKQSGFTLIEIAVVMIIVGLVMVAMVNAYLRWDDLLRTSKTREHISMVNDAFSAYVVRNYRVPCPANPAWTAGAGGEPFGAEIGSGADGSGALNIANCAGALSHGIVPFNTLGLDADVARDGWGNYLTYKVDPLFTQDMDVAAEPIGDPVVIPVHAKCRTTDWVEGTTVVAGRLDGGRNIAVQKARFCCVSPSMGGARPITVFSSAGDAPAHVFSADGNAWYDLANQVVDPNLVYPGNNSLLASGQNYYGTNVYGGTAGNSGHTDIPVYAIISHGKNEAGAFLMNGTTATKAGGGTLEGRNANRGDQRVYDIPHDSRNGANFYDDIVSWQTQSNLFARLKRDSCALP